MKKTTSNQIVASKKKPIVKSLNQNLVNLIFNSKSGFEKITPFKVQKEEILESYVSVKEIVSSDTLFLTIKHNQLQTLIDLSDLSNLFILGFNESSDFVGVSIVGPKANAPFQLLSQSKYLLIVKKEIKLDFGRLKGFKF
jgi:hypothetical protein